MKKSFISDIVKKKCIIMWVSSCFLYIHKQKSTIVQKGVQCFYSKSHQGQIYAYKNNCMNLLVLSYMHICHYSEVPSLFMWHTFYAYIIHVVPKWFLDRLVKNKDDQSSNNFGSTCIYYHAFVWHLLVHNQLYVVHLCFHVLTHWSADLWPQTSEVKTQRKIKKIEKRKNGR